MPEIIIAFGESSHTSSSYRDELLVFTDDYNQAFPSLTASERSSLGGEWEEIDCNDDTFSCNSAVWIGARSYAEIATKSGVQHEPIALNRNTYSLSQFPGDKSSSKGLPGNGLKTYVYDEDQEDEHDLWYQSKLTGCRKRDINQNIRSRQKKVLQVAYRRISHPHIVAWKQSICPMENELIAAQKYLQEINSINNRMPKPVCRGRTILIKDKHGVLQEQKASVSSIRLWHQQCIEDLCKNRRVRQIITAQFDKFADNNPMVRRLIPKNYYTSEVVYLEAIFRKAYYRPFHTDQYEYEHVIIPKLEKDYKMAREHFFRTFIKALPLPKDKSISSISRKKYALSVLLQE